MLKLLLTLAAVIAIAAAVPSDTQGLEDLVTDDLLADTQGLEFEDLEDSDTDVSDWAGGPVAGAISVCPVCQRRRESDGVCVRRCRGQKPRCVTSIDENGRTVFDKCTS
jgi:hypothetical protein